MVEAQTLPPHDIKAEESVLGSVLIDGLVISQIADLRPEHFYRERHALIFGVMLDLMARNDGIDTVTVAAQLETVEGRLESVGGISSGMRSAISRP